MNPFITFFLLVLLVVAVIGLLGSIFGSTDRHIPMFTTSKRVYRKENKHLAVCRQFWFISLYYAGGGKFHANRYRWSLNLENAFEFATEDEAKALFYKPSSDFELVSSEPSNSLIAKIFRHLFK